MNRDGLHPRISVLTPSYNYGFYIPDCVASVEGQSNLDVEHIIADGFSSDATVQYLQSLSSPSVKWWSEPDSGQSDALNKAFEASQGQVIGWLNADEFYLPGAFTAVADFFEANPKVDVLYGDSLWCDASGRLLRLQAQHPMNDYVLRRYGCFIPSCSTFFRREVLALFAPLCWDPRCHSSMDWELILRLRANGIEFGHFSRPLGVFRDHGTQITAGGWNPITLSEFHEISKRYGIKSSGMPGSLLRLLARVEHAREKLLVGAYRRQSVAQKYRHLPLRWFDLGEVEAKKIVQLLDVLSPKMNAFLRASSPDAR